MKRLKSSHNSVPTTTSAHCCLIPYIFRHLKEKKPLVKKHAF
ncbi:hypothetical protein CP03DC35_0737 [Chlamydia psittaci 03DC35]|nr:hypothetical protein CP02DC22_0747 [Chlamydia psittaci 02DC22]EPJ19988.1 hypothetical protein CP02DC21_0729 [Chlamydia psittaci 02DC21]EPJ21081.1 hypothetical protein CP02DC23_0021 [Chlamydia psittaci 02DC23]EPJ23714.1 hypothetical protein CP03DC29_0407 [Chlamydia psittaci 03DC29]EPJ24961.1 hypothetical protein CP08DC60_0247 [Chlamydia psittaci 08DC60]EPJ30000.1 hypothetical protein CP03DC35_0737 [Chlamydia psittaci 03DC35]EPJ98173.1 hypothetical protein CP02DC14_0754 [Chlamydia psittaci 0